MISYSVKENLQNWFLMAIIALIITQGDFDNPFLIWLHGIYFGMLFTWAVNIAYHWCAQMTNKLQNETKD